MKITELTAVTLGKKIKAKEITVAEAVRAVLEQIEAVEGDVHAYVTLKDKEKVLKKAEEIRLVFPFVDRRTQMNACNGNLLLFQNSRQNLYSLFPGKNDLHPIPGKRLPFPQKFTSDSYSFHSTSGPIE